MSTKNGKKSRNRRHEEPNFKPPPTHAIDESPKQNLKKNIVATEPEPEVINPIAVNIVEPNSSHGTGNSASSGKSRSRSNTPQSGKKMSLNSGSGNSKSVDEDNVTLANGGNEYGGGDVQELIIPQVAYNDQHLFSISADNLMEPLILDGNEPEPELLHLGDSDSPDQQQPLEQDDPVKNSPNLTRCTTRRSQTRYIPTPETPHSFVSGGDVVGMALEGVGADIGGEEIIEQVIQFDEETLLKTDTNTPSSTPTRTEQLDCTPSITITPSTPPTLPSIPTQSTNVQQQSLETSSTHSDTNLSDAATDNCSTHAVVGSDITRMNIEQLTLSGDNTQNDLEEDIYAEIVDQEVERQGRVDSRDSGGGYKCGSTDSADERPRRREGSIARALTGRRSIRSGTDYRKYLLERGMSSSGVEMEGRYSATLGREATSSSGIKRKTLSAEFSTSTPTTLKRRKLDTPQATVSWFSYLSQPLYSLKNRLTRFNTINTELPLTNTTPKLTGYKTKTNLEQDTVDSFQLNQYSDEEEIYVDEVEGNVVGDVSFGIEAMEYEGSKAKQGVDIPVALEVEGNGTASNRKSCAIM